MLKKAELENLYLNKNKSMQEIADLLKCSLHKVSYWMEKYEIKSRSRSDATYGRYHPHGDPFKVKKPISMGDYELMGLGLGLYWGEGTKSSKTAVRLGNTDPKLIKKFIEFLVKICGVKKEDMRFGLQIFNDINPQTALNFWLRELNAKRSQFFKIIVTPSRGKGTYKKKLEYGVLTVHYGNKKLRDILVGALERRYSKSAVKLPK